MNNIEKLAIEREAFEQAFKNHKLDTFHPIGYPEQWEYKYKYVQHAWEGWQAKALQSSEPVAEVLDKLNIIYQRIYEHKDVAIVANDLHSLLANTSFTHPPASVLLEKYNKLLDALKAIEFATKPEPDDGSFHENAYTLASQAIAEAEVKS